MTDKAYALIRQTRDGRAGILAVSRSRESLETPRVMAFCSNMRYAFFIKEIPMSLFDKCIERWEREKHV